MMYKRCNIFLLFNKRSSRTFSTVWHTLAGSCDYRVFKLPRQQLSMWLYKKRQRQLGLVKRNNQKIIPKNRYISEICFYLAAQLIYIINESEWERARFILPYSRLAPPHIPHLTAPAPIFRSAFVDLPLTPPLIRAFNWMLIKFLFNEPKCTHTHNAHTHTTRQWVCVCASNDSIRHWYWQRVRIWLGTFLNVNNLIMPH